MSPIVFQTFSIPKGFKCLALHTAQPERYPFLLESVAQSNALGRYDILFAFPQETLTCQTHEEGDAFYQAFQSQFEAIQLQTLKTDQKQPGLPFSGGWFSYFSYDYAQVVEPSLALPNDKNLPLACLTRIPAGIIVDHVLGQVTAFSEDNEAQLASLLEDIDAAQPPDFSTVSLPVVKEEPDTKFLQGVKSIKDYILAGDVFQVNLSREWSMSLQQADMMSLYQALRQNNPAPFAASAMYDTWHILSSSPERLVKYQAPWVETRPIAGTRKRSANQTDDADLKAELIAHPKERAEHIMLIDLERNDLGRICEPGSVEVNELMVLETYEHVHHIVSNIRGKLRAGFNPLDIIHAVFPGGTITGCPKIRCMEIIAELEQMPRKAYTGSLGYINRDGSLDSNILIRTLLKEPDRLSFRAGAGIVADSIAPQELKETRHKAKGLLNALAEKPSISR